MQSSVEPMKDFSIEIKKASENTARFGFAVIFVFLLVLGIWIILAPIHGAIVANGQLMVDNHRKKIQHLEGGVVEKLLVKEGMKVSKNQTLMVLHNSRVSSEISMLQDQIVITEARMARLESQKNNLNNIRFPSSLQEQSGDNKIGQILESEKRIFAAEKTSLSNQLVLIEKEIKQTQAEESALLSQIVSTEKTAAFLLEELKLNESLASKGFVASPRLLEFKRSLSQQETSLGEFRADIERVRQKSSELRLRAMNLKDEFVRNAAEELKVTQDKLFDLRERKRIPEDQLARQSILSPVDGYIVNLKVHGVGEVIPSGDSLMEVVPENPNLVIEVKISPKDVDEIHVGGVAEVKLAAFKSRTTPFLLGNVSYVSGDALIDEMTKLPVFVVHVKVDAGDLVKSESIKLIPGMPVDVFIQTKSRSIVDYLIEPVSDLLTKSLRES